MNVYCRATELLEAEVHDELVALQPDLGLCFGFNAVATTVWRELESPRSFAEIKDRLLGAYEVDEQRCSSELGELLDRMVAHGLVRVSAD